jgi:deoxyribodipyrimidine photo-lyase
VFWNRRHEPVLVARDAGIQNALRAEGLAVGSFNGALLHEPGTIQDQSGKPFQVFTPFWRRCLAQPAPTEPLPAPRRIAAPEAWPRSLALAALELEPRVKWAEGLRAAWRPGMAGAQSQLKRFLEDALPDYAEGRNRPDLAGTSRLSPHLHFGEITPRQIWHAVRRQAESKGIPEKIWRAFQFLTELGWMHNRVRMIAASFLVKDLLLSWQQGARWFWDSLVDADLAQNTLGWQWTAGCGADAAPYFRVFNPVSQGEKFDPDGAYVRRWCLELAQLPGPWLHQPWAAPAEVRACAGLEPGRGYPAPIVSHAIAREAALEAFAKTKSTPTVRIPEG